MGDSRWIWLSHVHSDDTPGYGGESVFSTRKDKAQASGDSCNTAVLSLSNHSGSHVDAPFHFVPGGRTIDAYAPEDWIFERPLLLDADPGPEGLISGAILNTTFPPGVEDADLVLIRTGMETHRNKETFWRSSPRFHPDMLPILRERFRSFNAIGLDAISISSLSDRELGREAHRAFLGAGYRIFEDLHLSELGRETNILKVIALPLRYEGADGAPTTLLAEVEA